MITGLGYAFAGATWKQRLTAFFLTHLYRRAANFNNCLIFQNPDDLAMFLDLRIVRDEEKTAIVNGSGVDIEKFSYTEACLQPVSFLLIARLIWDKGIREYVEAARLLKKRYPQVRFRILGPLDKNPHAITYDTVCRWEADGIVEYLGRTDDVRPYLKESSVYVLPSYREGTPRSVLEALSIGRPVVTTDAPGCRETVIDGLNGYLVPVKDADRLAVAMEKLIMDPGLILNMGKESRRIAVEKYDVRKVSHSILQAMELV
jgi:glycosyltransferase involved in cell wall biosynthesis